MNHPEYTRNTRTVPAIPGYPELFNIPGIIFSKLFKSTWKFPGIEISRYSRYFFHLRVFRVYPGLPGKLPEYPKNRPGNFQVDPGIPGYPQILLPGKKYLEYLEISIPGNFQVDLYPENTRKNTRKLVKRWLMPSDTQQPNLFHSVELRRKLGTWQKPVLINLREFRDHEITISYH